MIEYGDIFITTLFLLIVVFVAWCFVAWALSGLVRRNSRNGLRLTFYLSFPFLAIVTGIALWHVAVLVQVAVMDWHLLSSRYYFVLIFLLVPVGFTWVWTLPEVWREVHSAPREGVMTDATLRARFVAPRLTVPVQMGIPAAFLAHLVNVSIPSMALDAGALLVWIAYGFWRWSRQRDLQNRIVDNGLPAIPRFLPRMAGRFGILLGSAAGLALVYFGAQATSTLPGSYSMGMETHAASGVPMLNMTSLTGPKDGIPDRRITLTAQKARLTLEDGRTIDALTYNGQVPGPELRIRQGELVEVTLKNKDIEKGVTIHWHGVNVPNAEDGVAGVTQDAVLPGETYVYRFRAPDEGTYWYHSHQVSLAQVVGGLVGPIIVEPPEGLPSGVLDMTVALHAWREDANPTFPGPGPPQFDFSTIGMTRHARKAVPANTEVRLRVINTDPIPRELGLFGTTFKVAAIDGVELHEPGDLDRARMLIAAGGRYDLRFTMPNGPVLFSSIAGFAEFLDATLLLSPDGTGDLEAGQTTSHFDPIAYGRSRPEDPLPAHFDQEHVLTIETGVGFIDGQLALRWLVNGRKMPDMPHVTVREGEWVKITFVNRTFDYHPMHPHGHRMRVLSKSGQRSSGSPWYTDTLNVGSGETIEVAFKADNPGVWMDHCHNLIHASDGFVMHLLYENVMTPFRIGRDTRNKPD